MPNAEQIMQDVASRSGWHGLGQGFRLVQESSSAKSFMLTLKHGEEEAGYLSYRMLPGGIAAVSSSSLFHRYTGQGLGKGMYAAAMEHAKSKGAITFRSDVQQTVSESVQHVWQSAERAGLARRIEGEVGWAVNLTKAHLPSIEGLSHSGVSSAIRKTLTAFGSGWQGNQLKDSFERVVGRNFPIGQETLDQLWEESAPMPKSRSRS